MSKNYKVNYSITQYNPEWLDAHSKRMAELHMKIRALDDEIARAEIQDKYRVNYVPLFTIIGGLVGGLIGLLTYILIVGAL